MSSRFLVEFSRTVRMFRVLHGLTQFELAIRAGMTQTHIVRLESGMTPTEADVLKLSAVFGVPAQSLTGGFPVEVVTRNPFASSELVEPAHAVSVGAR